MSLTNVDTHTVTMWKLSGSRTSCFHSILFAFFLSCFAEEDLTGEEEEMPSFRGEGHMHTSLTTTNIEYTNGLCINVWIWLLFSVCVCVCVLLCYVMLSSTSQQSQQSLLVYFITTQAHIWFIMLMITSYWLKPHPLSITGQKPKSVT